MEENNIQKNNETEFIQKFGFDKIMQLDKETEGIFSKKFHKPDMSENMLMSIFADKYIKTKDLYEQEKNNTEPTYNEFKKIIYNYLVELKNEGAFRNKEIVGDLKDYDFIQGKFREEHPEIFINEEIEPELKTKFYQGLISAEDIKQNPKLYETLKTKRIDETFKERMKKAYLLKEISSEQFVELCNKYGKYFDNDKVIEKINNLKYKDISPEEAEYNINNEIYNLIINNEIAYDENLPETFKEKHTELFLPQEIKEETRNKFYKGELEFEDIKQNTKLKEILLQKDLDIGFRKIREKSIPLKLFNDNSKQDENRGEIDENWDIFSKEKILELAEKYGRYLEVIDCNIFENAQNFQDKKEKIEQTIEEKIMSKEIKYGEDAPEFFKNKYPKMILAKESPEELKESYYDGHKMNFEILKEKPEWKKYLEDKDIERAFPEKYKKLIHKLETKDILKLAETNIETINEMVENNAEDKLTTWYKTTGGKYIPETIVMLNVPENKIETFLSNSKKWEQTEKEKRTIENLVKTYEEEQQPEQTQEEKIKNEYSIEDKNKIEDLIAKLGTEPQPEPESEPEPEATPEPIVDPEPEVEPVSEPKPEQESTSEPELKITSEPEPIAETESKPEPEAISEPEPEQTQYMSYKEKKEKLEREQQNKYISMHERKEGIPVYDGTNMREMVLRIMKRMEKASKQTERLSSLQETKEDYMLPEAQRIIKEIAEEYQLTPENTKIIATNTISLIYEQGEENTKIVDIFTTTTDKNSKEWKQIIEDLGKALNQIEKIEKPIEMQQLNESQKELIQEAQRN